MAKTAIAEKNNRFDTVYNFCTDGRKRFTELCRLKPTHVFAGGFIPPLFGSVAAIGIALIFHNDEISNYNWQCGRARLPSLSRIINLPLERTFWQLCILMHVPIRIVELFTGFSRYNRMLNVNYERKRLYHFMRYAYLYVGLAELFFLAALSIVGERENIRFFIANLFCHRHSLYYLNPYGRTSYYLKILFASLYICSVPILIGSFIIYWKKCITWGYEVFAVCEYAGVFLNIAYHGCAFFDIRYKVVFSIRLVEELDSDDIKDNMGENKLPLTPVH